MKKDRTIIFENWSTSELFHYLMDMDVFDVEEDFEDWKHRRTDLLNWCKEVG